MCEVYRSETNGSRRVAERFSQNMRSRHSTHFATNRGRLLHICNSPEILQPRHRLKPAQGRAQHCVVPGDIQKLLRSPHSATRPKTRASSTGKQHRTRWQFRCHLCTRRDHFDSSTPESFKLRTNSSEPLAQEERRSAEAPCGKTARFDTRQGQPESSTLVLGNIPRASRPMQSFRRLRERSSNRNVHARSWPQRTPQTPTSRSRNIGRKSENLSHRPARNPHRLNFPAALFSKTDNFKRLLDMQFARLALGVASPVIVNAIRQIRVLLNLAQYKPRANRMRRPRRNEDGLARTHSDSLQTLFRSPAADGLLKFLAIHPRFQSDQNLSARPSSRRSPHSVFPRPPAAFSWRAA